MKTLTWQMVSLVGILVGGLVITYWATPEAEAEARSRLLALFGQLVTFLAGVTAGGAVAGAAGYLRGRHLL